MNFVIITHVKHISKNKDFFAYAPYVREMNIWFKHVDNVEIVAPLVNSKINAIDLAYKHNNITLNKIPEVEFTSFLRSIVSLIKLPKILFKIFRSFKKADHIHLRCPGNIGFLGCLVQILFPKKIKTAKYAGNWDPKAKQPLSYKFQKWILSNTFLTRNMSALVYGDWQNQNKNIKPFFTATYAKDEIEISSIRDYSKKLKFVFVGSLVEGKRPLLTVKIVESLYNLGIPVVLDIYGEGVLRGDLQNYINDKKLESIIKLHGNQKNSLVKEAFKESHFLILPSKSEGWPKAIAEAMFFGTIPIATSISCVPFMLDFGGRGILIEPELNKAVETLEKQLKGNNQLILKSKKASDWSQSFTLDAFENEIVKLLKA